MNVDSYARRIGVPKNKLNISIVLAINVNLVRSNRFRGFVGTSYVSSPKTILSESAKGLLHSRINAGIF
jgi:hypothetical protein